MLFVCSGLEATICCGCGKVLVYSEAAASQRARGIPGSVYSVHVTRSTVSP